MWPAVRLWPGAAMLTCKFRRLLVRRGGGVIPVSSPVRRGQTRFVSEFDIPRLCDLDRSSVVLGRAEWAIACQMDGKASVGRLAGSSGIRVRDAVERVTRLVQSGLCTIDAAAIPDQGSQPPLDDVAVSLPRRMREVPRGVRPPLTRPDIGLLKRIRDGLSSLD